MKVFLVWIKGSSPESHWTTLGDVCGSLEAAEKRRLEIIEERNSGGYEKYSIEVKVVNNGEPTSTGCYDCRGNGLNCENCNSLK